MKILKFISVLAASTTLLACSGSPKSSSSPTGVAHEAKDCPELASYTQKNGQTPLTVTAAPDQRGIAVNDRGETWIVDGQSHHSKTGLVYRGACKGHHVYVSFYMGDKPYGQQTYDWDEAHQYVRKDHWAKP